MKNSHRKLISWLMAVALAFGSLSMATSASAGETYDFNAKPSSGEILIDMLVMRPVMLVGTVVGAAAFIVSLPFSALGGNVADSAETLVVEPAEYTFLRPLGQI